jgi:hypothetical protein
MASTDPKIITIGNAHMNMNNIDTLCTFHQYVVNNSNLPFLSVLDKLESLNKPTAHLCIRVRLSEVS